MSAFVHDDLPPRARTAGDEPGPSAAVEGAALRPSIPSRIGLEPSAPLKEPPPWAGTDGIAGALVGPRPILEDRRFCVRGRRAAPGTRGAPPSSKPHRFS